MTSPQLQVASTGDIFELWRTKSKRASERIDTAGVEAEMAMLAASVTHVPLTGRWYGYLTYA